jgi:hypothetical protein
MTIASADADAIRASAAMVRKAERRVMVANLQLMCEEVVTVCRDMEASPGFALVRGPVGWVMNSGA